MWQEKIEKKKKKQKKAISGKNQSEGGDEELCVCVCVCVGVGVCVCVFVCVCVCVCVCVWREGGGVNKKVIGGTSCLWLRATDTWTSVALQGVKISSALSSPMLLSLSGEYRLLVCTSQSSFTPWLGHHLVLVDRKLLGQIFLPLPLYVHLAIPLFVCYFG